MTIQLLWIGLVVGLALLGFGTMVGNNRSAREGGMEPLSLLLKAAGIGVLTYTLYRHLKGNF